MANGDKTILYVDKVALDSYITEYTDYAIFNVGIYKSISFADEQRYDVVEDLKNTIISSSQDWYDKYRTGDYITDSTEVVQINNKDYYKLDAYIWTEAYTYSLGQKLFFAIGGDTMTSHVIAENNFEQTVVEFDYNLNKVTPDYFLWDVTDGVESLKVSYTEPPHKIISEIQYPDETIYDIKDKNALNKSQITNCLLEVPQRIKYTLEDGVLTIKAGSVVIVPYGVEDLSATYPVGATFINDNFKVYDTQYADGKFFVWVEVQNDIVRSQSSSSAVYNRFLSINISNNSTGNYIGGYSGTGSFDTSGSVKTLMYYQTDTNLVKYIESAVVQEYISSLPIMITVSDTTYNVASITQVFNGMGYIGSTVWADKGVKGLIPNGRNADGSLNNIEYMGEYFIVRTSSWGTGKSSLAIHKGGGISVYGSYTLSDENYLIGNNGDVVPSFYIGELISSSNVITSFKPKQPFRAVDTQDIDGAYMYSSNVVLVSQEALTVASGVKVDYDISAYLPNDGNSYLVHTTITVQTGNTTSAYCHVWTSSSDNIEGVSSGGNTTAAVRQTFIGRGWTLVRPDRILRTYRSSSGSAGILYQLVIGGYRKVI